MSGTPNISTSEQSPYPAERLLELLGARASRVVLLDDFSTDEARAISDGATDGESVVQLFELLLDEDPVSGRLSIPVWLRTSLLRELLLIHPDAAEEVADRLIEWHIGPDVTGVTDLLPWLVAYRSRSNVRAALAGLVACSPFEAIPVVSEIRRADFERPLISELLEPYRRTATGWLIAYSAIRPADSPAQRQAHQRPAPEWPAPLPWTGLDMLVVRPDRTSRPPTGESRTPQLGRVPLTILSPSRVRRPISTGTIVAGDEIWNGGALELYQGSANIRIPLSVPRAFLAVAASPRHPGLADTTRDLASAVILGRGRTLIVEEVSVDLGDQFVSREASIGVTHTVEAEGSLFAHLGSLPSSIGRNLPARFRAVEGERLVSGVGPVISTYCDEAAGLLRLSTELPDEGDALTASDWCRLSRSVREPWRFVSTGRAFVNLSEVRVGWRERVSLSKQGRDLWPYSGSSGYYLEIEGFWHGEDDTYSVSVNSVDGYRVEALQIDGTPRRAGGATADAPTTVGIHLSWGSGTYRLVLLLTLVAAAVLLGVSVSAISGNLGRGSLFDNLLPWLISIVSPLVGIIFTQRRGEGDNTVSPIARYRIALVRGLTVAAMAVVLIVVTSATSSYGTDRSALAAIDAGASGYLMLVTAISVLKRSARSRSLGRYLARGLGAARR